MKRKYSNDNDNYVYAQPPPYFESEDESLFENPPENYYQHQSRHSNHQNNSNNLNDQNRQYNRINEERRDETRDLRRNKEMINTSNSQYFQQRRNQVVFHNVESDDEREYHCDENRNMRNYSQSSHFLNLNLNEDFNHSNEMNRWNCNNDERYSRRDDERMNQSSNVNHINLHQTQHFNEKQFERNERGKKPIEIIEYRQEEHFYGNVDHHNNEDDKNVFSEPSLSSQRKQHFNQQKRPFDNEIIIDDENENNTQQPMKKSISLMEEIMGMSNERQLNTQNRLSLQSQMNNQNQIIDNDSYHKHSPNVNESYNNLNDPNTNPMNTINNSNSIYSKIIDNEVTVGKDSSLLMKKPFNPNDSSSICRIHIESNDQLHQQNQMTQTPQKENDFFQTKEYSIQIIGPMEISQMNMIVNRLIQSKQQKGETIDCLIILGLTNILKHSLVNLQFERTPFPIYILSTNIITQRIELELPETIKILKGIGDFQIGELNIVFCTIDERIEDITYNEIAKLASKYFKKRSCDIYVSSYWPWDVLMDLRDYEKPRFHINQTYVTAVLAKACCPRYHFTIGTEYYKRIPYKNVLAVNQQKLSQLKIHSTELFALKSVNIEEMQGSSKLVKLKPIGDGIELKKFDVIGENPYQDLIFHETKLNEMKGSLCRQETTHVNELRNNSFGSFTPMNQPLSNNNINNSHSIESHQNRSKQESVDNYHHSDNSIQSNNLVNSINSVNSINTLNSMNSNNNININQFENINHFNDVNNMNQISFHTNDEYNKNIIQINQHNTTIRTNQQDDFIYGQITTNSNETKSVDKYETSNMYSPQQSISQSHYSLSSFPFNSSTNSTQMNEMNKTSQHNQNSSTSSIASNNSTNQQRKKQNNYRVGCCWFCLSTASMEMKLIISCAYHNYLSYCKGPIVPNHLQLIPIHHIESYKYIGKKGMLEMRKFYQSLKSYYAEEEKHFVMMELSLNTNDIKYHTYMQILPIDYEDKRNIVEFSEHFLLMQSNSLSTQDIVNNSNLINKPSSSLNLNTSNEMNINSNGNDEIDSSKNRRKNRRNELKEHFNYEEIPQDIAYLYVLNSKDNKSYYIEIEKDTRLTIIREIMCKWYNLPKRINWKHCQEEYSLEEKNAREIRHKFLAVDTFF